MNEIIELLRENNRLLQGIADKLRFQDVLLLDLDDAEQVTRISKGRLRERVSSHSIPHIHNGNRPLFPKEHLREWIRNNVEGGDTCGKVRSIAR